jgi:hypothetical protein
LYCGEILRKRKLGGARRPHVKNDGYEPVEKNDCEANVGCDPPRGGKRRYKIGDLAPVESEDTHGHAVRNPKQLVNLNIVGSYPADPGEARESSEEIGGQEIYDSE